VNAGGVDVRAVGTVFNVRLDRAAVEVVVSEGRVKVDPPAGAPAQDLPVLVMGQSAVVSLVAAGAPPEIATLSPAEIDTRLAWQPRLLDFTNVALAEIVADFNRRNPVQLVVADPALASVRLSAAFRSDNVEGFVRLMESDFGMKADWRGEREIVLRRAK
jgi:transmembrane sensor